LGGGTETEDKQKRIKRWVLRGTREGSGKGPGDPPQRLEEGALVREKGGGGDRWGGGERGDCGGKKD